MWDGLSVCRQIYFGEPYEVNVFNTCFEDNNRHNNNNNNSNNDNNNNNNNNSNNNNNNNNNKLIQYNTVFCSILKA